MPGDNDKTQLQDLRAELDGLVTNLKTIHERTDSTVTTANERFEQLHLAQTATKRTLDTIVSRLDALNTVVTDLVAQGCVGDDEPEDADRRGKARRVPRRSGNDSFSDIKFKIPTFNGKYDPALDWELEVEQKFSCHDIAANSQVKATISEFTEFALIWWREYKTKHPTTVPTTWDELKAAMRHRFVPSYYARDLLNKMQCFQQGSQSVEDCYQELQKGMIRCGLFEENDAAMARFHGGLNREIQNILDYKEYDDMATLFSYACKAEREVQGCHSKPFFNSFSGRSSTSGSGNTPSIPPAATLTSRDKAAKAAGTTPSTGTTPPTGRTRDITCFRCSGRGHMDRDCPNTRTLIIHDDGEYSSASDSEDNQHTLLATDFAAQTDVHVNPDDTDRYETLVVQLVLSTQVASPETNQCHTLFHKKGVVQERSIRIIIDSGSCNNLASTMLVEKMSLPTRKHSNSYYIQWLNDGGKIKVSRLARVPFSIGAYSDYVDCDVVPMEACSLLLGRPWQYDTNSLHHGCLNHYSLLFKGQKIIIHPMTPEQIVKDDLARTVKIVKE
jgi:hypothetical protein